MINNYEKRTYSLVFKKANQQRSTANSLDRPSQSTTYAFQNNPILKLRMSQGVSYASPPQQKINLKGKKNIKCFNRFQQKGEDNQNIKLSQMKDLNISNQYQSSLLCKTDHPYILPCHNNSLLIDPPKRDALIRYFTGLSKNSSPQKQKQLSRLHCSNHNQRCRTIKEINQIKQLHMSKAKSIMIIKKNKIKRQNPIQNTRQFLQKEFHSRKEIPIHHTQFYFRRKSEGQLKTKAKTQDSVENNNLRKISESVMELMKLKNQLRTSVHLEDSQQRQFVPVHEETSKISRKGLIIIQHQKLEERKQGFMKSKKWLNKDKKRWLDFKKPECKKQSKNKGEWQQQAISPWYRKNNNDFQYPF